MTGRGDEGLHGGRVGHAGAMEGGQWPRSRDGGELRALRSSWLSSEKKERRLQRGGNGRRRPGGVSWREIEARAACCVAGVERMLATQWRARLAGEEDKVAPLGWARWAFALGER